MDEICGSYEERTSLSCEMLRDTAREQELKERAH
jgi:hypothetical protein